MTCNPAEAAAEEAKVRALQSKPSILIDPKPAPLAALARSVHFYDNTRRVMLMTLRMHIRKADLGLSTARIGGNTTDRVGHGETFEVVDSSHDITERNK